EYYIDLLPGETDDPPIVAPSQIDTDVWFDDWYTVALTPEGDTIEPPAGDRIPIPEGATEITITVEPNRFWRLMKANWQGREDWPNPFVGDVLFLSEPFFLEAGETMFLFFEEDMIEYTFAEPE
ncbi:MAG: hypothetical protein EA427_00135, partial [Spirochaetaceae bacterium]